MKQFFEQKQDQQIWNQFVKKYKVDLEQQEQFKKYFDLIMQENQKYNITAITSIKGIIQDHFYDSLALIRLYDLSYIKSLADIGTGGGIPGIPLAIMNPEVAIHLVEVNNKKINFLTMVKESLGLDNVVIHTEDFRTFLRQFTTAIDLFTARASLSLKELLRIFKPSSPHKEKLLVYWASKKWVPTDTESMYLNRCISYRVGEKNRSLCFFKNIT